MMCQEYLLSLYKIKFLKLEELLKNCDELKHIWQSEKVILRTFLCNANILTFKKMMINALINCIYHVKCSL